MSRTSAPPASTTDRRRRRSRPLGAGLAMVAIVGLAACGDDGPEPVVAESAPAQTETVAVITILDFDFGDPVSVIEKSAVRVENADGVGHTWTSDSELFASGFLEPGDSFEFVFDQPGDYSFFCEIHPSMTGTVTVTS